MKQINPGLLQTNLDQYEGLELSHFEDQYGGKLNSLYMQHWIVIVFKDGRKIRLTEDWRGNDFYISQYDHTPKELKQG